MASPTATPPPALEETDGDVTYVRTDPDLPPVVIIDRSPITTRHKIVFGIIALLGAVAWAIIAFARGETVNAVWFVIAAITNQTALTVSPLKNAMIAHATAPSSATMPNTILCRVVIGERSMIATGGRSGSVRT